MDTVEAVSFSAEFSPPRTPLVLLAARRAAVATPGDVAAALHTAVLLGQEGALVGQGSTAALWEALATTASADLGAARAIEPHLDALAILDQAGQGEVWDAAAAATRTWGVFAAEGTEPLRATVTAAGWQLDGLKPWCSLADRLDAALITATDARGERHLFAVELGHAGVEVVPGSWHARGLSEIPSGPVRFTAVPAVEVGEPGWYLRRAGFSWGGIGVAACWFGGAVGVARTVFAAAVKREDPDRLLLMHLGAIDERLQSVRRALAEAARLVDAGRAEGVPGKLLAKRVRATVADACENILQRAGHALGPALLAQNPNDSKRVADLQLYIRQHHAERDEASLGEALIRDALTREETAPW
ncbi:alkylation response protein AidB-like acyl-CoA dehydrogenase [Glaciihabitans tibetensis]|uniref:Alkylation response protein AidB-like acyl-CoA dehydrogenase n=1 Tax=Glaciihabitans tibetensis TaxID=1266600 RepID=A0A2T0VFQ2_9MICO|nr:acyl-CoA dehydrogenase [Glaciihabitans tibetensis]PRY68992.1 alkylation response protein AidB-like acyl-CoA dehydrogenase [Glaciihabitans tibetensis]